MRRVIWFDESEDDGVQGDKEDDFSHSFPGIIISERAHKNVTGLPYASALNYTYSSDLPTWQNVFHVGPYLQDVANATYFSDMFQPGGVPNKP